MTKYLFIAQAVLAFLIVLSAFSFSERFLLTQLSTYFAVILFLIAVYFDIKNMPLEKSLGKFAAPLMFVLSFIMVFSLYGQNLQAKWGVIDDHEIMRYLGTDSQMDLKDFPTFLSESEAVLPGKLLRYRPTYQILRLLETTAWDNNPGLWYGARILMFTFVIFSIWYILSEHIGFFSAGVFSAYIFSYDFWRDIFSRLGPSEAYATVGFAAYALAFNAILFDTKDKKKWPWILLTLGSVVAMGSKENMLFLLIPTLAIVLRQVLRKRFSVTSIICLTITIVFSLFMTWAVVTALSKTGQDVYSQSVSTSDRLSILVRAIKLPQSKKLFVPIILASLFWVVSRFILKDKQAERITAVLLVVLLSSWSLMVSQYIFYNGAWPNGSRYDFPGVLYEPVIALALIVFAFRAAEMLKMPKGFLLGGKWGLGLGVCFLIIMKGFVSTVVAIEQNVVRTRAFTSYVENISNQVKKDTSIPIIFESTNVWDYEPIYSNEVFLRAHGVSNPIAVRIDGYAPVATGSGLEADLTKNLIQLSEQGNAAFVPLSSIQKGQPCYSLFMSAVKETECQLIK